MRTLSALMLGVAVTIVPVHALAHPILDEAAERFGEADFEGALEAYGRAELADDLTRDDLVRLYLNRALTYHTVGDAEKLELDLFRLATLEPEYDFGRQVPPMVEEAFARVKEENSVNRPLSLVVEATNAPGGIRVEARVEHDLAAIVQTVRVALRTPGNAWTTRENSALEFPTTADQTVEYYAEAIGPGGAVIANLGSADEPESKTVSALVDPDTEITGPIIEEEEEETSGVPVWPFLLGGAVAAVAGGVLAVLLITKNESSDTNLGCCTILTE